MNLEREANQALVRLLDRLDLPNTTPPEGTHDSTSERYILGRVFARGGLGVIRQAYDRRLIRLVAMKELRDPHPSERTKRRFLREAHLTAKLEHPAIIPIHDVGHHPLGAPYYCMKLVEGHSLADLVASRDKLVDRLDLLHHIVAVSAALSYAHSRGVIHRDLKPQNILVGAFGETVVIDWGLAKDLGADDERQTQPTSGEASELTQVGEVLGTLAFMPPEQAAGESVDHRADIYAVGAILYFLISGVPPFDGCKSSLRHEVAKRPPIDIQNRTRDVPKDVSAIIRKAMVREPQARYQSMSDLNADLRQYLAGGTVTAQQYTASEHLVRFLRRYRLSISLAAAILLLWAVASLFRVFSALGNLLRGRKSSTTAGFSFDVGSKNPRRLFHTHRRD